MKKLRQSPKKLKARSFESGDFNRLTFGWKTYRESIGQVVYSQLPIIRTRARQQAQNNDYVRRLIQLMQNNVVGEDGIRFRSLVENFSGKPDNVVRSAIEIEWRKWCDRGVPSIDSHASMADIEHIIMSSLVTDGEVFARKVYGKDRVLKIQLTDPVIVDIEYNDENKNIRMGIKYDENNKAIGYYLNTDYRNSHPSVGYTEGYSIPREYVPCSEMIHIFRIDFVGQERGIPWIATSLYRLKTLQKYEDAALLNAQIGACKMGFFSSPENEEYTGDNEYDDFTINAEAGTFENIGSMNFQAFDPTYPTGEFDSFVRRSLKGMSSGMGVDYHTIGNDPSDVNYSSARVAMLETREYWRTIQSWLIRHFVRPVFNDWLSNGITYGIIKIKNRNGREIKLNRGVDYYLPSYFQGRRWDWVDPQKEMDARKTAYEMRITSLSQIIRDQGQDPDTVFREISEESEKMDALGITSCDVTSEILKEKNDV